MKIQRSKKKLLLVVMTTLPMLIMAQSVSRVGDTARRARHELSVQQAVDYGIKNNAQVKNALLDVKYQEQVNREVTSRAYPSINGNLGTTYNPNVATQVIPNFIGPATYQVLIDEQVQNGSGQPITMPNDFGFIAAQFGTKYSANVGVTLSQILFDGQVFVGLQARNTILDFARKNVEVTGELIKTNIYKIYYQLVVGKTQLRLMDSTIALVQKNVNDTRIIYETGLAAKLDVDRASVQLTNLKTNREKVANMLSNGYYGLKLLMGMPIRDELVLSDTITENQIKDGMLDNIAYSYDDRKEYQYAQLGKSLREYDIRRYKLSQIPTVTLNGNYAKNAQRDKWNFFGKGEWFTISSVSLNVNVPIFNGFFTRAKIEQARINLQKSENDISNLQLAIDMQVDSARNTFRSAVLNMDAQSENMKLAESVYRQTKTKYEVGTGSQTEINTAQTEWQTAQSNYIGAMGDAIIARIDFLRAIGKL